MFAFQGANPMRVGEVGLELDRRAFGELALDAEVTHFQGFSKYLLHDKITNSQAAGLTSSDILLPLFSLRYALRLSLLILA